MVKCCSICLEDIEGYNNTLTLNCNHIYHIDCYTKYILHEVQEIAKAMKGIDIKCPMCRAGDRNMFMPLLEVLEQGIEDEVLFDMFICDIEDKIIKEMIPTLLSILEGNRFSKKNLKRVMRKICYDYEKDLKLVIKDVKKS